MNTETIRLLSECSSGIRMASGSIDAVRSGKTDDRLRQMLAQSRQTHERLGQQTKQLLHALGAPTEDVPGAARAMSWMKTNWKLMLKPGDATVADLITDGCGMGVKSISRFCNQYPAASGDARRIAHELIASEQKLTEDIRQFL